MRNLRSRWITAVALTSMVSQFTPALAAQQDPSAQQVGDEPPTATPIKHVIVIIGENRTFDNIRHVRAQTWRDRFEPAFSRHRESRWHTRD